MSNARGHRSNINGRGPPRLIVTRSRIPAKQTPPSSLPRVWLSAEHNGNLAATNFAYRSTGNSCMASASKQLSPTFPCSPPPPSTSGQTNHQLSHIRCYSNPSSPNFLSPKCFTFSSSPSLHGGAKRPNSASRYSHHSLSPSSPTGHDSVSSPLLGRVHATKSLSPTNFVAHACSTPPPPTSQSHPSGFRQSRNRSPHQLQQGRIGWRPANGYKSLDAKIPSANNGNRVPHLIKNQVSAHAQSHVTRTRNGSSSRVLAERSADYDAASQRGTYQTKQKPPEMSLNRSGRSDVSPSSMTSTGAQAQCTWQDSNHESSSCQEATEEFDVHQKWASLTAAQRTKLILLQQSLSLDSVDNNPGPCQDFGIRDYLNMTGESIDNEEESSVAGDFNVGLGVGPPRFSIDSLDATTMSMLLEANEAKDRLSSLQFTPAPAPPPHSARRCSDETGLLRRSALAAAEAALQNADACNHGERSHASGKLLRKCNSMPHASLPKIHEGGGCVILGTKAPMVKRMELRTSDRNGRHNDSMMTTMETSARDHRDVMRASHEEGTIEEIDDAELWDMNDSESTDSQPSANDVDSNATTNTDVNIEMKRCKNLHI